MSLGNDLKREFVSKTSSYLTGGTSVREDCLFRLLIDAFKSLTCYSVGEIHGNKRQVIYTESNGWFTKTPRCELGDIVIVAFSKKRRIGRIIIIQNKVARTGGYLSNKCRGIYASLVQYELLKEQHIFEYVKNPRAGIPNKLLRSLCSSVCQYGIFYKNLAGNIDMSSITANKLYIVPTAFTSLPSCSDHPGASIMFNGAFETMTSRSGTGDFVGAENLKDFGDLLEDLYIGKPIGLIAKRRIEKELLYALELSYYNIPSSMQNLLQEFQDVEFINQADDYNDDVNSLGSHNSLLDICRSLIMINVDSNEDYR